MKRARYHIYVEDFYKAVIVKDPTYRMTYVSDTADTEAEALEVAYNSIRKEKRLIQARSEKSPLFQSLWQRIKDKSEIIRKDGVIRKAFTEPHFPQTALQ